MKFKFHTTLFIFFIVYVTPINAQFFNLPSDYFYSLLTERELAKKENNLHTGIKPYIPFFSNKYFQVIDSHRVYKYIHEDQGVDFVFYNHLINIAPKNEMVNIKIDPVINFEAGKDKVDPSNKWLYTNTRGAIVSGNVGKNVYFETMFVENQSLFTNYINNSISTSSIVPGQGRYKTFKTNAYDYAFASGFVSIQAAKNFNIQVGHGKQKIGQGYRSLLLSDNAFNYPYVRFTEQWFKGKVQYSSIYAVLMNFAPATKKQSSGIETLLQKKAAAFQYLSILPNKFLNISFFQGMIWQAGDERNRQNLSWQYFNPVIFTNAVLYGLNNKNNILIGSDIQLKLSNRLSVYYQNMFDDMSNKDSLGNSYGQQVGLKFFDAFGVKKLFIQAEYNYVTKNSYSNIDQATSNQGYNHYNQNLANAMANGQELIVMADYKFYRCNVNLKYNYQDVPAAHKNYYYNNILNLKFGYTINTAYNLNLSLGYTYRNQNFTNFRNLNNETGYFYLGLKTGLYNNYYDF